MSIADMMYIALETGDHEAALEYAAQLIETDAEYEALIDALSTLNDVPDSAWAA